MHERSPARIATLLDAYLAASYRWEYDGDWHDLAVGAPAPRVDATFPEARCYALLSAWHPHSVIREEAANRAEDARLTDEVAALLESLVVKLGSELLDRRLPAAAE